jgi:hypothetical protein
VQAGAARGLDCRGNDCTLGWPAPPQALLEIRGAMIHRSTALPGQRRGLFARIALAVASTVLLVGAAILGAFVFVALLGLFVLAAAALWARVAWLRWRLGRTGAPPGRSPGTTSGPPSQASVLEGDYVVLPPDGSRGRR